jgi:rare lipoprotein A
MNTGCKQIATRAARRHVAAVQTFVAVLTAISAPVSAQDLSWLADQGSALEKPWALGVKPQAGWRLEVVKPSGSVTKTIPAVINRSWPATVTVVKPRTPQTTGALTPVSYTPYSPPDTTGIASFYWQDQMTSSGERFDKTAMTAAHKTLPMHTRVRVTRLDTGRSVIVRINDRGPFKPGRIIDLSDAAAEALGMRMMGLAQVKIDVVR